MRDWSSDEVFVLIREYEARRCLWDKTHQRYKNNAKRAEEYRQIARQFTKCNANDVKEKIRNLRTIFWERLRKVQNGGSAAGQQPKWQFFSALGFLKNSATACDSIDWMEDGQPFEAYMESLLSATQTLNTELESETSISSPLKRRGKSTEDESKKIRSEKPETGNCMENSKEMNKQNYEKFGAFVASTIESMQNPDLEELCEVKIRMILAEISNEAAKRQLQALETRR